jgi:hypothetical protein
MDMNERPRRHSDSSFRKIADEGGLVVLPGLAEVKVLNPAGLKIFSLLDGEHTLSEIARAVCDEFEVEEEQALRDVTAFVDELARHGMLMESEAVAEGSDA